MGYGFWITAIASVKLAMRKGKLRLASDYVRGFFSAKRADRPMLVNAAEAKFVRKYRWKKMLGKVVGKPQD